MWPGESAIGQRLRDPPWRSPRRWYTVVGIVRHVHTIGLDVDPLPQVYWNYRQWVQDRMVLAVRSTSETGVSVPSVLAAIRAIDSEQSVYDVQTMTAIVNQSTASHRLALELMAAFGVFALVLAAAGIYGVVAYDTTQRTREFGLRVALGAAPAQITTFAAWQGTSSAIAGAGIGLAIALAAGGALNHLVFGVAARDTASMLSATALLLLVATVASYAPARRAAAIDPAITLRAE